MRNRVDIVLNCELLIRRSIMNNLHIISSLDVMRWKGHDRHVPANIIFEQPQLIPSLINM